MITTEYRFDQATPTAAGSTDLFDGPRKGLGKRYVYAVMSPRAKGLSVGVNLNPTRHCNFDCIYCEVDRNDAGLVDKPVDLSVLTSELETTLKRVFAGELRRDFPGIPAELLQLRHVALSGDGEPTLCPNFGEAVEAVVHLRASARAPRFKIVLITNASCLHHSQVAYGVSLLTRHDEIWAKLDGGTQRYLDYINRAEVLLAKVLENIRTLGKQRPVIIQTMVPAVHGENPFQTEVAEYAARLCELKE